MKTILDLAKQAGLKFDSELSVSPQEQKFAELIIKECSKIADSWVDNDDNGKNYPSEIIKQHFGIEE